MRISEVDTTFFWGEKMKREKEIEAKLEEAKKLWEKNPDYWQGYREALEWVLEIHIRFDGVYSCGFSGAT